VYSLLRERIDLHAQLFDAVQIQRKLSGPRVLRYGDMQFASEVFAARFLSGDFTTFSQDGSKVLAVLGDIAGKGVAAGMCSLIWRGFCRVMAVQTLTRQESPRKSIATCVICSR
jgi:serine phosphatase RsbU (regulator of sigma subunit)